ncbi:MAG: hypothetical protein RI544_01685 [Haloquadratum sp.]|nr:hypothetical protein [Haloferacaceae archaeon]MDR9444851.1 hypothetical protein [Haloquadratum sp.]
MGLTCQLIGHQFGEATTERMREERGGEMVTTEREVRVCARCGDRLVISQNTEVVAIRGADTGAAATPPESAATAGDPHLDDILDPSLRPSQGSTGESGTGALDPGTADPAEEDAEILEPPASSGDAAAETATPPTEQPPDPPTPPTEEPAAPRTSQRDQVAVDRVTSARPATRSVDTVGGSDAPVDVADLPDEAVEFYCPACGYAVAATLTSMRSGDICPACRGGYIAERARRQG